MNIVIVDDEWNALNYLANVLKKNNVIKIQEVFTDPIKALVYLLKTPCDAIFLDIEMPHINGMYIAEQILNVYPETRICFVTAYNEFAVKAFEINAVDYVLKPFSEKRIDDCVRKFSLHSIHRATLET